MASKRLIIEANGTTYTLEFTRRTVEQMERQGFVIRDMGKSPMTSLPTLFRGAFLAHHRTVQRDVIDEIFAALPDKDGLFDKLAEMYVEPIEALMADPEEDKGNVKWEANW